MKFFAPIICGFGLSLSAMAGGLTNMPPRIELPDQYEQTQRLVFPSTNITILTLADRKGSEQIAGWVDPLSKRFGKRVEVQGIADVSAVPRILRGTVRAGFRRDIPHPVMMDWSGTTIQKFAPRADVTTVLVINGRGQILRTFEGAATSSQIEELSVMIEKMLTEQETKVATKP